MERFETLKTSLDKPEVALYNALKEAHTHSKISTHRHMIVEKLFNDQRKWSAKVITLYEPAQTGESADTHLFIRERDESVFRDIKQKFDFAHVTVTLEGKFWECVLEHHPNLEMYEATHGSSEGDEEGGKGGSGKFTPLKLVNDIIQAFSSKKPRYPDMDGPS